MNLIKDQAYAILQYCSPKDVFERNFKIITSNKSFDNIFQKYIDSSGDTCTGLYLPEDFLIDKTIFEEVLIKEDPVKSEIKIQEQNLDLEMIAFAFGEKLLAVIFNDITKRKNAELKLNHINSELKIVFEESPDATLICDSDWIIKDANISSLDLFRTQKSKIIGKAIADIFVGEFGKKLIYKTSELKLGQSYSFQQNFIASKKNKLYLEIMAKKIRYIKEYVTILIFRDISNQRLQEEKLITAKLDAEKSDKLKTAFLSNMSHEIRTPMNAILGFSDLLKDPKLGADSRKKYIQLINNSSNMLLTIIEDIVDIAKIEANEIKLRKESCDLHSILKNIYDDFNMKKDGMGKKDIELRLAPYQMDESPQIYTDPYRLQQIIGNLVNNSLKFTNEGHVEFGYQITLSDDPQLTFEHCDNDLEVLKFFVKDTGIGMNKKDKVLVFERFRQAKFSHSRSTGGTGLGLTISKTLINLFGGKIWVDSEPDKGTLIFFTIPFETAPVQISIAKKPAISVNHKYLNLKDKTILIAEDDDINYCLLVEMLKGTNATILWAKNGQQSIDIIKKHPETDLILMDIRMPEMDGYQATKKIKKMNKDIPIIVQTAFAMVDEQKKSFEAGCDEYVAKPLNTKELLSKIKTLIL